MFNFLSSTLDVERWTFSSFLDDRIPPTVIDADMQARDIDKSMSSHERLIRSSPMKSAHFPRRFDNE